MELWLFLDLLENAPHPSLPLVAHIKWIEHLQCLHFRLYIFKNPSLEVYDFMRLRGFYAMDCAFHTKRKEREDGSVKILGRGRNIKMVFQYDRSDPWREA